MRIKAALYNADHLEYGLVTIPFPIPQDQYNDTIKMLEALDIGDPRAKDCMVEEIEGCVPSLKCLEGHRINVDELDYLVKRLDSFSDGEPFVVSRPRSLRTFPTWSRLAGITT